MLRFPLWLALSMVTAAAQGTQPKAKVTEYPAHTTIGTLSIGAENWGHAISCADGATEVGDYIAVEVALYNEGNKPFTLSAGHFSLRLNGKKQVLYSQSLGIVQASLKYPGYERETDLTGYGGVGNGGVVIGGRPNVERFPGDPRPQQRRVPFPSPAPPSPGENSAEVRQPKLKPEEIVAKAALVEGEAHPPVSGFLFFAYKGKLKSIKKMELLYEGPAGAVSLALE
jgi:hypothetical protein